MKLLSLSLLIATLLAPSARAATDWGAITGGTALSTGGLVLSFLYAAFPAGGKNINMKTVQSDAALVVAGGAVSASLSEVFASLREHDELNNLDDQALAAAILKDLAAN
jgi:hypothetical protein